MADTPSDGAISRALRSYFTEFGKLKHCSRPFWVVQLVNLLDGVAYFGMLTVSTLYLSETLGYSDASAGWIWGLCMWVYTGMGFVAGFIGDSLGIKRTLYISVLLLVVSRLIVGLTEIKALVIPALFVIAIGTAIMTPILISATKRYTTKQTQTAGFNLLYFLMNIGAFLGNITIDPMRKLEIGNRGVFLLGSVMSILCWLAILIFWRKGIDQVEAQQRADAGEEKKKWEAPWTIAADVFRESAFWRFMLFLVILVGVRLVFEHQYQVYPKYYQRTMAPYVASMPIEALDSFDSAMLPDSARQALADQGKTLPEDANVVVNEAGQRWRIEYSGGSYYVRNETNQLNIYSADPPIGKLNSINPFIICIGVIISTPIVARYKLFNVMFVGIVLSASSMLLLVIYPGWFCHWFGMSVNQGYVLIAIVQICLFSLGEVIWSPRLYEYTAAIAPPGREASYMGLSYLPMFFARFAEGPLAGALLTRYCPPDVGARLETTPYAQSPQFMNVILAILALASPFLILLFRGVIQKESRLEDEQAEAAAESDASPD